MYFGGRLMGLNSVIEGDLQSGAWQSSCDMDGMNEMQFSFFNGTLFGSPSEMFGRVSCMGTTQRVVS